MCFVFLGETIDGIQDFIQILDKISQRSPNGPGKQSKTELFVLVLGVLWGSFPHLEAAFLRMATVPKHSSKRMKLRATKTHIVTSQFVYLHLDTWAFLSFLATGSAFSTKVTHLGLRHLQSRILLTRAMTAMTAMVL